MRPAFVFDILRKRARKFRHDKRGNVAAIFGFSLIPVLVAVGAAVDYSRGNNAKASMQMAIDATGLMLSKDVSTLSTSQLSQKADTEFRTLLNRTDIQNLVITPTYTSSTTDGYTLNITATGNIPVTFLRVLHGRTQLDLSVNTLVRWGNTRLRVALVLDNTGSMSSSNKLTALQTATSNLIDQLKNAAKQNGDIYVSIVPFVKDVNVDPTNNAQNWIDWTGWEAPPANVTTPAANVGPGSNCPWSTSSKGFGCQKTPTNGSTTTTKVPSSGTYKGYICPTIDDGSKNTLMAGVYYNGCYTSTNCTGSGSTLSCQHAWVKNAHSTWNGCVVDRGTSTGPSANNYDTNVVTPTTTTTATLLPAEQYSSCPQPIMPLTYDWTSLKTLVNNMVAAGNTNQAIGLDLGWMSLVGGGPFPTPPAMDPNYQYKQVIILLTDGLNTQDRWYLTASQIDARQQMTCDNINAAGITLYTVQVNTDAEPTSTLLQNCAGKGDSPKKYPDPDKFFLLTSSTQIVTTFNQIATNLANLYLAK
jgi:Flp pilus assembly protein TadG